MRDNKTGDMYDFQFLHGDRKKDKKYVYHYTTLNTLITHIARSGTIKFTRFSESSDTIENTRNIFILNNRRDWLKSNVNEKITRSFHLVCFSQGDHTNERKIRPGYLLSRMWSQYGEEHRGVCLAFDRELFLDKVSQAYGGTYKAGNVDYNLDDQFDLLPHNIGITTFCYDDIFENEMLLSLLFFSKEKDYRDEREWRVVINNEDSNPIYVKFENSLRGIVFGHRLENQCVKSCCKYLHKKFEDRGEKAPLFYQAHFDSIRFFDNENETLSLLREDFYLKDRYVDI